MPTFVFNKLVRDKFRAIYDQLDQKIVTRTLSPLELKDEIRKKIIEEAMELPIRDAVDDEIIDELADVQQALDDLRDEYGVSPEQVAAAQAEKFAKKGGFREGLFVETIGLTEDDEWVEYYRNEPKKYKEVKDE